MTIKKKQPLVPSAEPILGPGKGYRIRFRSNDQVDYIKAGAKKAGIPFNTFVNYVCELAAVRIMESSHDGVALVTKAVIDSLTER